MVMMAPVFLSKRKVLTLNIFNPNCSSIWHDISTQENLESKCPARSLGKVSYARELRAPPLCQKVSAPLTDVAPYYRPPILIGVLYYPLTVQVVSSRGLGQARIVVFIPLLATTPVTLCAALRQLSADICARHDENGGRAPSWCLGSVQPIAISSMPPARAVS